MKGFFEVTPDKFQIKSGQRKGISCAACGLYSDAKSPRMKPYGEFQKGIMVIGDSPDQKDDASGKPWQGSAGRFLRKEYARHGIDLYKDCLSLNSINCYMGKKGGKKSSHAISCCRPSIFRQIKTHSPKVIILHGESALTSIIGAKWNKGLGGLSKWRTIIQMGSNWTDIHPPSYEGEENQEHSGITSKMVPVGSSIRKPRGQYVLRHPGY